MIDRVSRFSLAGVPAPAPGCAGSPCLPGCAGSPWLPGAPALPRSAGPSAGAALLSRSPAEQPVSTSAAPSTATAGPSRPRILVRITPPETCLDSGGTGRATAVVPAESASSVTIQQRRSHDATDKVLALLRTAGA